MADIRFTQDADRDLIDIYLFGLTEYGAAQAERYAADLTRKIELIAEHPSFGANYGHVRSGLRRSESGAHSIYYQATETGVLVLRILYKSSLANRHL